MELLHSDDICHMVDWEREVSCKLVNKKDVHIFCLRVFFIFSEKNAKICIKAFKIMIFLKKHCIENN